LLNFYVLHKLRFPFCVNRRFFKKSLPNLVWFSRFSAFLPQSDCYFFILADASLQKLWYSYYIFISKGQITMANGTPTKEFLTSGLFARICGVNKQTLLYYEKLQLFSPCQKDENGRRYYSSDQIDIFHVILALREIVSLNELKRYIQKRDKESFQTLYEHSIKDLTAQIHQLETRRLMMEKKIALVQEAKSIDTSLIYTQYCPREYLKLSAATGNSAGESDMTSALSRTIQYRIEHNLCLGRAIGGMVPTSWLESGRNMGYRYYYSELAEDSSPQDCFTKKEGNYLISYHKGDYHSTYLSYPKILSYARQNHLRLGDYVYEESLIDEVVELNPENYITKISVPFTVLPTE